MLRSTKPSQVEPKLPLRLPYVASQLHKTCVSFLHECWHLWSMHCADKAKALSMIGAFSLPIQYLGHPAVSLLIVYLAAKLELYPHPYTPRQPQNPCWLKGTLCFDLKTCIAETLNNHIFRKKHVLNCFLPRWLARYICMFCLYYGSYCPQGIYLLKTNKVILGILLPWKYLWV